MQITILHIIISTAQDNCLVTNNGNGLPFFQGYSGNAGRPERRIQHQHQAIIPSYRFNCYGNITEWGVDLNPAEAEATFDFDLQVWRPSPTVNQTGCYSLVNNFLVRSTSIPVTPEVDNVARVTPLPQDRLQFQPGDVLGFYVESHGTTTDDNNGVVLLNNASYTSELAWHASITALTSSAGSCPYPVGSTGVLNISTRAAPVISISVTTYSCSTPSTCTFSLPRQSPPPLPQPEQRPLPNPSLTVNPSLSQAGAQSCVPANLVVAVALPVVSLFGILIVIAIAVIVSLYCRIRKLQKVTAPVSAVIPSIYTRNSCDRRLTLSGEEYDSPKVDSTHLIRPKQNVAYAVSSGTMERQSAMNANSIRQNQNVMKW